VTILIDLTWYVVIIVAAGAIFATAHIVGAQLRLVSGATSKVVALAVAAAIVAGLLSWLLLGGRFSSSEVHALASLTAPLCFLGFCAAYLLVGPVTIDRSITLTILETLLRVGDGGLTESRLMSAVPFDRIFDKRLFELQRGRFIERTGENFRLTSGGGRILRAYLRVGRLLNVETQSNFARASAVDAPPARASLENTLISWCNDHLPIAVLKHLPTLYYRINGIRFRWLARPVMVKETSKAKLRRVRQGFFDSYCTGKGLDVGYGGDLVAPNCRGWDVEDGDAHMLATLEDNSFDFVYSSHLLEHLEDPSLALKNWWRVLKPGGYLVLYIPDRDLLERKTTLPSEVSLDHKHYFLLDRDDPPDTIGLEPLIVRILPGAEIVYRRRCDDGYRVDDVRKMLSEAEYSIEIVAQKPEETEAPKVIKDAATTVPYLGNA